MYNLSQEKQLWWRWVDAVCIKKRKFFIERKLDEYDQPSYEEDEEQDTIVTL